MRPLRYSINVTLDGCCDHRAIPADEELHRHAVKNLEQADALLFGRVTYEMMEAAFRPPARTGAGMSLDRSIGLVSPRRPPGHQRRVCGQSRSGERQGRASWTSS